jgi:hypothetical protein
MPGDKTQPEFHRRDIALFRVEFKFPWSKLQPIPAGLRCRSLRVHLRSASGAWFPVFYGSLLGQASGVTGRWL